ncbi:PREDICTED: uncharacterized protein LOC104807888 [Tarenaya hassleriana]|uniref:uncharacterized protein LOC104807888 n=1 Tax=Tarenaya hassleriana TaxID=28532 RepID=UPI00053C6022|nr:PREDICTED: uncharacterized protein LOC104807888 [Tarenaya hassleriana]
MDQPALSARTSPRRRPLETCGAAIIATARVCYTRSQNVKSSTAKLVNNTFRAALYVSSFMSPFHRYLLAMLSVADDRILALQETLETYLPFTRFISLKIQHLLVITETLPEKLDNAMEKAPGLINHASALDWILALAIYYLDCLVGVLTRFRDRSSKEKEKEIMVDKSFSSSGSVFLDEEEKKPEPEKTRATYKEVLQKWNVKEDASDDDGSDPILELFETRWILNPTMRSCRSADSLMLSLTS